MSTMTRPRRTWTAEEDTILRREVEKAQTQGAVSWHEIASFLPGRTNKDCRKRWYGTTATKVNKGPWTEDEDERLGKAVQHHGAKWAVVASVVGTRLPDQCSKRWMHALNPEIDHSPWTAEEDELLVHGVEQYGHCWQQIVSLYFPRRSSLSAKNRYHLLQRRMQSEAIPPVGHPVDFDGMLDLDSEMDLVYGSDGGFIDTLPSISPLPTGDLVSESVGFPFPSSINEHYDFSAGLYPSAPVTPPGSNRSLSCNPSRPASSHRRVTIQAVCSTDNLGDMFKAVTDFSISAVFKTDN